MPIDDHHRSAGGGLVLGGLLTAIDSLGGLASGLAVLPKWIVTTSLTARLHELHQLGPLGLHGRVLRRGKNSVVCAVDVVDEGANGVAVASAMVTCAVLDPGSMRLGFDRPVVIPGAQLHNQTVAPDEFFRIAPGRGATARLEFADHLRNPWGILHGGAVASLVDAAASRAATAALNAPVASGDTVLHFLSPARIGPVEARSAIVGSRRDGTVVRVAVHDMGADDRLAAVASVVVRTI
jgi:uncharacterized protein (TIGR00369 family)